ncbi:2'-5' RNA ligase family protein [Actinokineospora pegani]|uniref:2'-5' RNA ligase family protein n=1 Tax=Actinokineospora pegani TaxID=2654637 RepID=UPI0012E9BFC4|nr:2'-5' RNA ligase family protein [Actinokineospora pegani]
MTRYFSAFDLPAAVSIHLAEALGDVPAPLRPTPRGQWHVTVGYYGAVDPVERLASLRERAGELAAPTLRLRGSGTFASVVLLVVRGRGAELAAIAEAADAGAGGHEPYRPHVTVARWARGGDPAPGQALAAGLADYTGPWWTPSELVLYASELGRHTPVDRVRLRLPG